MTIASSRQTEESNEVMKQAMEVYLFSGLSDSIKVDSSLDLTNKALDLDNQNIQAFNHKSTLLLRKRDIEGMIEVADELIKLRPKKSLYLGQKAIFFELKGDLTTANRYYKKALNKYQEYLKKTASTLIYGWNILEL